MPITSSTAALFARLAALGVSPEHPATGGICNALGVWPGDVASDAAYPVLGFHVTTAVVEPANLTCYLVTAGKFARYEWTASETMTFVCGIDRVTSVTEKTTAETLTVSVELDAQPAVTSLQAHSGPVEGGVGTVAQLRHDRAGYTLVADTPEAVFHLAAFSRGLRAAVGV